MSVKSRLLNFTRALKGGEGLLQGKPEVIRDLAHIVHFLLGLCLSTARIFGVAAPFGLAIVAEAGSGTAGVMSLLGVSLGYVLSGGFEWGIKYIASAVLIFTASFMFRDTKIYKRSWFMPGTAALVTAVTSFLNSFDIAAGIPTSIVIMTEVMLTGGCAYFFDIALSDQDRMSEYEELKHGVSLLILLACALMSLSGMTVMGVVSIGRTASILIVMAAAYKGGMLSGSAVGAALGLAMDVACGGTPFFTMAYSFAGLISGVLSKHGRLFFVLGYVLSNAVAVLWTWGGSFRIEILFEVFSASVLFLVIPVSTLNSVGGLLQQTAAGNGEAGLRRYSASRLDRMSDAFEDLYKTVRNTIEGGKNDNDIASIFDRAADSVCISCRKKHACWSGDYVATLSALNDASESMMKRGSLKKEDLPTHFVDNCLSIDAFVVAANGELRSLTYRKQYKSRLSENRAAAYGQYADLASIMRSVATELQSASGPDALAEKRLLRFLRSMDIEAEVSVFRDRGSRLRAVIESGRLGQLIKEEGYLDKLSTVIGVRLCRPASDDMENESRLVLMEAEPLAVSVGIAAMKKKGEPVSGDRGTYFKTDQGVLCVILSDGMGSGEEAARESISTVRILERFLRSGVEPGTAMKILNSVMLLKNGEEWGYATIDLVCINLFTGETFFYKYGAAPSYVKSGKAVRRIRGESLAAGVCAGEGFPPDMIKMRLKPNSIALIASDGVLVEEDDAWLRALLTSNDGTDTKTLAKEALQGAVKQYGCDDDMTVLAVRLDKRA